MRTVVVDDHALFRDGVASLLLAWGHEVVGQASDGNQAIELVDETSPDVVLMDVRMPNVSGIEATAEIKARHPEVAIVMLTVSEEEADLFRAIKAGAQGHLLKNLEAPQLRSMLEGVARGEPAISPGTAARVIDQFLRTRDGTAPAPTQKLTDREVQVLELVTDGQRNREIAVELGISENTVKFHLKNIVEKLHAQNRAELAARAVREGLVSDAPHDSLTGHALRRHR
ncbi:MAG TPA: response regulator transcription factor [Candidatus Limnocylindrales bacterium]|jgi:DNA-binding NarL/FixJ family response regulator